MSLFLKLLAQAEQAPTVVPDADAFPDPGGGFFTSMTFLVICLLGAAALGALWYFVLREQ